MTIWMAENASGADKIHNFGSRQEMKFELLSRVALKVDVPSHGLRRGDLGTIVEEHVGAPGQGPGYSLEIFNAIGETVAVITLRESEIEALSANEILHVRPLATAA
jgi:hypothetical protein